MVPLPDVSRNLKIWTTTTAAAAAATARRRW
jgi:hypothetical protein